MIGKILSYIRSRHIFLGPALPIPITLVWVYQSPALGKKKKEKNRPPLPPASTEQKSYSSPLLALSVSAYPQAH